MDMIGQPDKHCSFSLFCGYSDKKKNSLPLGTIILIFLFKNRPIVPDATLDQVDPLVSFHLFFRVLYISFQVELGSELVTSSTQ